VVGSGNMFHSSGGGGLGSGGMYTIDAGAGAGGGGVAEHPAIATNKNNGNAAREILEFMMRR
jgi:hypothetical protein